LSTVNTHGQNLYRTIRDVFALKSNKKCQFNLAHKNITNRLHSHYVKKKQSFPSHKAHKAPLIFVLSALSQTSVYTARPRS